MFTCCIFMRFKKDHQRQNVPLLVDSTFILMHTRDYSQILKTSCTQAGGQTGGKS
jgi:hypothetical protein